MRPAECRPMEGKKAHIPAVEWVLIGGVIVGTNLPWIGPFPGRLFGTLPVLDSAPPLFGVFWVFALLILLTALLPLSSRVAAFRALTVLGAVGAFGWLIRELQLGEYTELMVRLTGQLGLGVGLFVTAGCLFLLLLVTLVSVGGELVRARRRS